MLESKCSRSKVKFQSEGTKEARQQERKTETTRSRGGVLDIHELREVKFIVEGEISSGCLVYSLYVFWVMV